MNTSSQKIKWRMPQPCDNCPFNTSGAGLLLRRSLTFGRWQKIVSALRLGDHFVCHKTSDETGDGSNLVCAGSIQWQNSRGINNRMQQFCEWLTRGAK